MKSCFTCIGNEATLFVFITKMFTLLGMFLFIIYRCMGNVTRKTSAVLAKV